MPQVNHQQELNDYKRQVEELRILYENKLKSETLHSDLAMTLETDLLQSSLKDKEGHIDMLRRELMGVLDRAQMAEEENLRLHERARVAEANATSLRDDPSARIEAERLRSAVAERDAELAMLRRELVAMVERAELAEACKSALQ